MELVHCHSSGIWDLYTAISLGKKSLSWRHLGAYFKMVISSFLLLEKRTFSSLYSEGLMVFLEMRFTEVWSPLRLWLPGVSQSPASLYFASSNSSKLSWKCPYQCVPAVFLPQINWPLWVFSVCFCVFIFQERSLSCASVL